MGDGVLDCCDGSDEGLSSSLSSSVTSIRSTNSPVNITAFLSRGATETNDAFASRTLKCADNAVTHFSSKLDELLELADGMLGSIYIRSQPIGVVCTYVHTDLTCPIFVVTQLIDILLSLAHNLLILVHP